MTAAASITSAKTVIDCIRSGWELWHVSNDALPGRWELRRGREHRRVSWCAVEIVRKRFLALIDELCEERQEGRYTWSYAPKQRLLTGGMLL